MKRMLFYIMSIMAMTLTGCRGSVPFDNITRAAEPRAFNHIVANNGARAAETVYDDVSYYIVFDDENRTANITISNLRTPAGDESLTLTFMDCEMTYTSNSHMKERIVKADVLVSNAPGSEGVAIENATFVYTESNWLDANGIDGIYARFTIDGYTVTAYPYHVFADGTTRIDYLADGTTAYDYKPVYTIDIDPDAMTATLKVYGIALGGESGTMTVSQLQFAFTADGYALRLTSQTCMSHSGYDSEDSVSLKSLSADATLMDELKINMGISTDEGDIDIAAFLSSNLAKSLR